MPQWLIGALVTFSVTSVITLFGGLWAYSRFRGSDEQWKLTVQERLEDHEIRMRKIEDGRVTQATIDELRMSLMATVTNSHNMLDKMLDKRFEDVHESLSHLMQLIVAKQ